MSTLTKETLAQFTGSTQWFRHSINRTILYTEGVQYLAEAGGAYWLLDAIAISNMCETKVRTQPFQVWTLQLVKVGEGAWLTCEDGDDREVYRQHIPYTDFPLDSIKLYCEYGGDGWVMMLPRER